MAVVLAWRLAVKEDEPALQALLDATEARLGPQDRPDLFAAPVILCLVAEDRNGRIHDAIYVECIAEIRKLGLSPDAFRATVGAEPLIRRFLARRGFHHAHITIAHRFERGLHMVLGAMGFSRRERSSTYVTRV